mmetsp:Transcript_7251/g.20461  ORF Transcript_7251/g.20461 Transcript_7251/m.20461 type:complete len:313 (-) Transcript_7251:1465-2403(-)
MTSRPSAREIDSRWSAAGLAGLPLAGASTSLAAIAASHSSRVITPSRLVSNSSKTNASDALALGDVGGSPPTSLPSKPRRGSHRSSAPPAPRAACRATGACSRASRGGPACTASAPGAGTAARWNDSCSGAIARAAALETSVGDGASEAAMDALAFDDGLAIDGDLDPRLTVVSNSSRVMVPSPSISISSNGKTAKTDGLALDASLSSIDDDSDPRATVVSNSSRVMIPSPSMSISSNGKTSGSSGFCATGLDGVRRIGLPRGSPAADLDEAAVGGLETSAASAPSGSSARGRPPSSGWLAAAVATSGRGAL